MEITNLRCERLEGTISVENSEEFYEEHLSQPIEIYAEHRNEEPTSHLGDPTDDGLDTAQYFLYVETDDGERGIAGPLTLPIARRALRFEQLLVGEDPLATERLWDFMYRSAVHGRKGEPMHAISAIDVALWDLAGKHYGEPVYRLLGGPTREKLPAYASMLGYSVDPDRVRERATEFADRGYDAQKWFFRHGPGSGTEGKRANVALVEAAREAVGDDYDLMFDAWMSWGRAYATDMIDRLAPFQPRWLEEPVMPDNVGTYAALRADAPFPIAGGEHEYTRWGAHELLERDAVDVLQLDTYWAGGLTEMRHACSIASAYEVPMIPHGHSVPTNVHLVAAQPPDRCPLVEYLVKWNVLLQHFFDEPVHPEDGVVAIPERPGIGVDIDDSKVDERAEVTGD